MASGEILKWVKFANPGPLPFKNPGSAPGHSSYHWAVIYHYITLNYPIIILKVIILSSLSWRLIVIPLTKITKCMYNFVDALKFTHFIAISLIYMCVTCMFSNKIKRKIKRDVGPCIMMGQKQPLSISYTYIMLGMMYVLRTYSGEGTNGSLEPPQHLLFC